MQQAIILAWQKVVAYFAQHAVQAFFARVVIAALISAAVSKLFGPKVRKGALAGAQTMTRGGLEYRKVVYGKAMVSGPVTYNNVEGASGEYLWFVVALAGHVSEDITEIWLDGESIPKADIDWTVGTGGADGTGTGQVTTSKWVGDNSISAVRAFYYLGASDQPVNTALNAAFTDIGSNFRLRGITYAIVAFRYDEDTATIWKAGVPRDIKALVSGRQIYDPRLDSTQIINPTTSPVTYGSGSHRTTDATTWAWSDNPSLCVADYLTQYMSVPTTSVDWQSIAETADDCDVLAIIPPAASPQNTEKRFTCNGAISLGESHKDNLSSLLSSMDGRLAYTSGVWKLRASVWEAPSLTITTTDLAGDVSVRGSAPRDARFNTVRGFFVDPDRKYESAEFTHVTDSTYVTRDNGETITYDLQLPCTNSLYMAQRVAYRNLKQGDNQIIVNLVMNARGAKVAIGDVVTLNLPELGWDADASPITSKTFRVIEWARTPDGKYSVSLREDQAPSYTDPLIADYSTATAGTVTIAAGVVPAPTNLAATAVAGGIYLTWTNPTIGTYDVIDIYEQGSNTWGSPQPTKLATVAAGTDNYKSVLDPGQTKYYWIRAVRLPSTESLRSPNSDTSTITATSGQYGLTIGDVTDFEVLAVDSGSARYGGIRVDSDGDIYRRQGASGSTYTSIQTYLGSGTNAQYECKLTKSDPGHDTPDSVNAGLGTWLACSSDRTWEWASTAGGGADAEYAEMILSFRRTTDNVELVTINIPVDVNYL